MIKNGIDLIEPTKEKKIGIYYPSELSYCERKNYYSYLYKSNFDWKTHTNMRIGTALHALIQEALLAYSKKKNLKIETEIPDLTFYDGDIELHGRLDVLVTEQNGSQHLIEIKTHSDVSYIREPEINHLAQLNYYLQFYREAQGHILYVNKAKRKMKDIDYVEFKHYPEIGKITYDVDLFKELLKRARRLDKALKERQLLPPEAKLNNREWECYGCQFKDKCNADILKSKLGETTYKRLMKQNENYKVGISKVL